MEDILYKNSPSDIRIREMVSNIGGGNIDLSVDKLLKITLYYNYYGNGYSWPNPDRRSYEITEFNSGNIQEETPLCNRTNEEWNITNIKYEYPKLSSVSIRTSYDYPTTITCISNNNKYYYFMCRYYTVGVASRTFNVYLEFYIYESPEILITDPESDILYDLSDTIALEGQLIHKEFYGVEYEHV